MVRYLLNGGTVVLGYVPLSFLSVAHTGGMPSAKFAISAGVILVLVLICGAFLLKSTDVSTFRIPLLSAGYVAAMAVLTVFATVALAQSLWTLVAVAFVAAPAGGLVLFVVDRLPK